MKKYDVTALGELLIDMTDNGVSEQGNTLFEANPGGAPCNVLAMLRKLNHSVCFIGKVGDDIFGHQLKRTLDEIGIDSEYLCMDQEHRTTLAFVETLPDGDRNFSFYRNPGADMMLQVENLSEEPITNTKIMHFGTLSMTHEGVRNATKHAVETAKRAGAYISFDPNIREPLWNSLEEAKAQVLYGLGKCDILKISDNEIRWLTEKVDFTEGVNKIRETYKIPLILVSMGKEGSRAYYWNKNEEYTMVEKKAFIQEKTIETTGAGDTFMGCVLHFILKYGMENLTEQKLSEMLTFANAAASIITTKRGALRVMPTGEEIDTLVKKYSEVRRGSENSLEGE